MDNGWVKLHRELTGKAIFHNEKLLKVFIWCILRATHDEYDQLVGRQVVHLQPGQFVTGRLKAGEELHLKPSTAWDYIKVLKNNKTIDIKSNNKYSVITVVNWDIYQYSDKKTDSKSDNKPDIKSTANQHKQEHKNIKNNIYTQVIDYLNQKTGTNFRPTSRETQRLINARLNESYTVDDFIKVIDTKSVEWKGTEFEKYLRPATLFGPKFENYLNAKPIQQPEQQRRVPRILNQE